MANIKLTLPSEPFTRQIVTFPAPCDCASVTDGIIINDETYTVCDAMGNKVTGTGGVWCSGAQISVVLDCENKKAYLQNGNTTPALIGAASADTHRVPHYRYLTLDLGLNDADMSTTDLLANLLAIYEALHAKETDSELWLTLGDTNLRTCLLAKINSDLGLSLAVSLVVKLVKRSYLMEVYVMPQSATIYGYEFSCVFRYYSSGHKLSPFTITRNHDGFVSKAGDTMTGDLNILDTSNDSKGRIMHANHTTALHSFNDTNDATTRRQISLYDSGAKANIADALALIDVVGGKATVHNILHTGNIDSLYPVNKVVTGSYTGTGTYGEDNPNSLTFDGVVKFLWVFAENATGNHTAPHNLDKFYKYAVSDLELTTEWVCGTGLGSASLGSTNRYGKKSADGKTVYWYNESEASHQFNQSGSEYYYMAILE